MLTGRSQDQLRCVRPRAGAFGIAATKVNFGNRFRTDASQTSIFGARHRARQTKSLTKQISYYRNWRSSSSLHETLQPIPSRQIAMLGDRGQLFVMHNQYALHVS
ncbi:hypothetical protein BDI4_570015 [Burkholderia diffusa]|nr:hypothetical protein BDI4_570015 [Burkholderia diffusa]